jgi:hypothetical protein
MKFEIRNSTMTSGDSKRRLAGLAPTCCQNTKPLEGGCLSAFEFRIYFEFRISNFEFGQFLSTGDHP